MRKELARITKTTLGYEDHGLFIYCLHVEYDSGSMQGIGTHILDDVIPRKEGEDFKSREGTAFGMEMIARVLKAVGVSTWEELKGRNIWVLFDESHHRDPIGIEGTFNRGKTLIFEDVRKQYFGEEE